MLILNDKLLSNLYPNGIQTLIKEACRRVAMHLKLQIVDPLFFYLFPHNSQAYGFSASCK